MKKEMVDQFLEIFKKSLEVKEKKLDAVWRSIHASANVLFVQYKLYVKARKKKGKKPLDFKEWIDSEKPEK
jgi:hypothetical protein